MTVLWKTSIFVVRAKEPIRIASSQMEAPRVGVVRGCDHSRRALSDSEEGLGVELITLGADPGFGHADSCDEQQVGK